MSDDPRCDGSRNLPCRCPAAVRGEYAYHCHCKRRCDGCIACGPDPADVERKRRDDEAWYYSRVGTAPAREKASKAAKAADQPRLF